MGGDAEPPDAEWEQADRAAGARRRNAVVDALDSVLKGARDVAGL
ncbi:hypothetical protein HEK616_34560 [Streptomyces nigrescens]|uniref:Uncharacterized protein n=1 Tax=Streptomyces nigrescens TaxID=1920 RepID=A0ABM7ZUB5_STRNI|nr:hypothetical protein HEK616_34560 [Streptomyces nigrescens]